MFTFQKSVVVPKLVELGFVSPSIDLGTRPCKTVPDCPIDLPAIENDQATQLVSPEVSSPSTAICMETQDARLTDVPAHLVKQVLTIRWIMSCMIFWFASCWARIRTA